MPEFSLFYNHAIPLIYTLCLSLFHSEDKLKSLLSFINLHRVWSQVTALGPQLTFFSLPPSASATLVSLLSLNTQATLLQTFAFAVPSTCNGLLHMFAWLGSSPSTGSCSDVTFPESPHAI